MWFGILLFVVGVYIGYKYPQQVQNVVDSAKKMFGEIKDKVTKKTNRPRPKPPSSVVGLNIHPRLLITTSSALCSPQG